ncbi:hypothetical protein B0J13DRAFT_200579 [Dactylonectria estremocensis]|uniref:Rhodopsin domain-containing protein n=1 Tax=Dactylonectria estremocensis TaxID=1079267 RepID=A0A9P9IFI5_9HYPO|nr:hypothetical protein B0J13DRAFT_200579 [Dactylonectria estremocensis]
MVDHRSPGGTTSRGRIVFNLNVALIVITSVIVLARLYVRRFMTKALGLDDLLTIISFVLCIAGSATEIAEVGHGSGTPIQDVSKEDLNAFFTLLAIGELLYFLASGFIRLSILAFLPRLSRERFFMRWVWGLGVVIVGTSLAGFFFILTECKPIGDLFKPGKPNRNCISKDKEAHLMWAHAILGICIDIVLFGLPIWVIRRNMKFGTKTIQVILVFCVGLFAIITGIVRFGFVVTTDFTTNTTYKTVRVSAWTMTEVHVGLWCSCFPALQPLLRLVSYKVGLRSGLDSTSKKTTHGTGTHAQSRSDWPGANGYFKQHSDIDRDGDGASQRVIVSGGDSTTEYVELDEMDKGIMLRTDVVIKVEEGIQAKERHEVKTTWDAV